MGIILHGFCIGIDSTITLAVSNLHSASENETVVQAYLDNEIVLGHIVGPLDRSLMPRDTQISQFLILDIM